MIGEQVAMLVWGGVIGWTIARLPAAPIAAETQEHEIGRRMVSIVRSIVETRRFVGRGMTVEKRWRTPTRFGDVEVIVTLLEDGEA